MEDYHSKLLKLLLYLIYILIPLGCGIAFFFLGKYLS